MTTTLFDSAIEALADAWASADGKCARFRECKENPDLEATDGYYGGYMADAEDLMTRLQNRGFVILRETDPRLLGSANHDGSQGRQRG